MDPTKQWPVVLELEGALLSLQPEMCGRSILSSRARQRIYYILPKFIPKHGSNMCLALLSSLSHCNLFFMPRESILRQQGQLFPGVLTSRDNYALGLSEPGRQETGSKHCFSPPAYSRSREGQTLFLQNHV